MDLYTYTKKNRKKSPLKVYTLPFLFTNRSNQYSTILSLTRTMFSTRTVSNLHQVASINFVNTINTECTRTYSYLKIILLLNGH